MSSPEILRRFLDRTIVDLDINCIIRKYKLSRTQECLRIGSNTIIVYQNKFIICNDIFIKEMNIDPSTEIVRIEFNRIIELKICIKDINSKSDFFNYLVLNDVPAVTYDDVLILKNIIQKMKTEFYD